MEKAVTEFDKKYSEKIDNTVDGWQRELEKAQDEARQVQSRYSSYMEAVNIASDIVEVAKNLSDKMRVYGLKFEMILQNANDEAVILMKNTNKVEMIFTMNEICENIEANLDGLKTNFELNSIYDLGDVRYKPSDETIKIILFWRDLADNKDVKAFEKKINLERKQEEKRAEEKKQSERAKLEDEYKKNIKKYNQECSEIQRKIDAKFEEYSEKINLEKKQQIDGLIAQRDAEIQKLDKELVKLEAEIKDKNNEINSLGIFAIHKKKIIKESLEYLNNAKVKLQEERESTIKKYDNQRKQINRQKQRERKEYMEYLQNENKMPQRPQKKIPLSLLTEDEIIDISRKVLDVLSDYKTRTEEQIVEIDGSLNDLPIQGVLRRLVSSRDIVRNVIHGKSYYTINKNY